MRIARIRLKNTARYFSVAGESFFHVRVNQRRTKKKRERGRGLFTSIIEIAEYPVAILRQRRGRSASGS